MDKVTITGILIGGMAAIVLFVVFNIIGGGKGIVAVEGYEHGVAFCEHHYHTIAHASDATTWADGTASYVVNKGHYDDPEVKKLIKLAHKHCAQYKE